MAGTVQCHISPQDEGKFSKHQFPSHGSTTLPTWATMLHVAGQTVQWQSWSNHPPLLPSSRWNLILWRLLSKEMGRSNSPWGGSSAFRPPKKARVHVSWVFQVQDKWFDHVWSFFSTVIAINSMKLNDLDKPSPSVYCLRSGPTCSAHFPATGGSVNVHDCTASEGGGLYLKDDKKTLL